jgi:hypothetical protein
MTKRPVRPTREPSDTTSKIGKQTPIIVKPIPDGKLQPVRPIRPSRDLRWPTRPGEQIPVGEEIRRARRDRDLDNPNIATATPFLVVPAMTNDFGQRPIDVQKATHCMGIQLLIKGKPVQLPTQGQSHEIQCIVRNLGVVACYTGLVEFHLGARAEFDKLAAGQKGKTTLLGIKNFIVQPGTSALVKCPKAWKPATLEEADWTVMVQAYDLLLDPVEKAFKPSADRHVGRRDAILDFSGTWTGMLGGTQIGKEPTLDITIKQTGDKVTATCHIDASSGPDKVGVGTIKGNGLTFETKGPWMPTMPQNLITKWSLTLKDSNALHADLSFTDPKSGQQKGFADLNRV